MNEEIIKGIAFIKSTKNREKILNSIGDSFKIPSEISKETGIRLNHVSKMLKEMKKRDIVKCINEEDKKGRIYVILKKEK